MFSCTGEYIQLPLQLEEILQDVLQLADLANENDQVVSRIWQNVTFKMHIKNLFPNETKKKIILPASQDEILAEQLEKSEYSNGNGESSSAAAATASTSNLNQFDANFAFPSDKVGTAPKQEQQEDNNNDDDNNNNKIESANSSGQISNIELPLLLDPPLTEEEISADLSAIIDEANDLDDLNMMIQSATSFQPPHPRPMPQNYGHANANMYHRQQSYHQSQVRMCKQFHFSTILLFIPWLKWLLSICYYDCCCVNDRTEFHFSLHLLSFVDFTDFLRNFPSVKKEQKFRVKRSKQKIQSNSVSIGFSFKFDLVALEGVVQLDNDNHARIKNTNCVNKNLK